MCVEKEGIPVMFGSRGGGGEAGRGEGGGQGGGVEAVVSGDGGLSAGSAPG